MKQYPNKQIDAEAHRIYTRPFRVGAFGKMKTGKSSLLNALLGARLLPVKSITATAVRTNIHYAKTPKADVVFKNNTTRNVPVDDVKSYIVHTHGKTSEVSEVNLHVQLPFGLRDCILVDTPGIDDLAELNEVSEKAIDDIDLAILVFDATRFISSSERKFCVELNERLAGNVLFVINKTDGVETDEIREMANVYLRTYGNSIVGAPKVLYTATPENEVPNLDGLPELLSGMIKTHHADISKKTRNRQLAQFVSAQLEGLFAEYSAAAKTIRDTRATRVMGYIARLNKARGRISEIVSPFDDTCRAIIADEGLLTVNNMLYCLNNVSKTFVNQFNGSLNKLRTEFGITSAAKVEYSSEVTARDLRNWGIGAFFEKSMDERVFDEILRIERQKLCANIGKTFTGEEQKYAKSLAADETISGNAELQELQLRITGCEALIQELRGT